MATIHISNKPTAEINPYIYGNFMEFIENHISGMWAEMLDNRRMEVCLPGKSTPERWQPYAANNAAHFTLLRSPYNGTVCQQIACTDDNGGFSGILQKGIGVTKGRAYTGSVYLRGCGADRAEIAVGRDYGPFFLPYASAFVTEIGGEWRKYTFAFTSDTTDDDAEVVIRFPGVGTLWVDHPSLMPEDNMDGWRKDVVEHTRRLKPGILRFPGGCYADTYHWQNAVGPRDLRKPQSNYHWSDVPHDYRLSNQRTGRHWRPTEPNDVGIDEFMRFCELTDSEALLVINMGTGTPEEAAAWVEYCNGAADSPYGSRRAQNGHAAPYHVRYWQIGNEMYGPWEVGYSGRDGYIKGYKAFHAAMRAVDAGIRFIIDGDDDDEWNRAILTECAGLFDVIDVHYYPGWDIETESNPLEDVFRHFITRLEKVEKLIDTLRREIDNAGLAGKVKIAVCEYNISGGGWGPERVFMGTQGAALYVAGFVALMVKNADIIEIGNFSNLTNAWWASAIRTRREQSHTTASYHALSLFANLCTGRLLPSALECEQINTRASRCLVHDAGMSEAYLQTCRVQAGTMPALGAVAAYDGARDEVAVAIMNYTENEAALCICLDGFTAAGAPRAAYTTAPAMHWLNDFASPERIAPLYRAWEAGAAECILAPCSLTVVRIPVIKS